MTNLRFKEYTFRNNPRRLVVLHRKRTTSAVCCGFGESLQQLGPGLSEVQGEGELFGEDAMEQFAQLRLDGGWQRGAQRSRIGADARGAGELADDRQRRRGGHRVSLSVY